NSLAYSSQQKFADENQTLYRLPVAMGEMYADAVTRNLPPGGIVFADTAEPILTSLSGKLFPVLRNYNSKTTILPARGGVVVLTAKPGETLPDAPRFSTMVEQLEIENGMQFGIYLYPSGEFTLPPEVKPLDIPTDQGLRLVGYSLLPNKTGERWTLTTFWRVEVDQAATSRSSFGMYARVVDDSGTTLQSVDGQIIPGFDWHPGDIQIHTMRIMPPTDAMSLRIGQFDASNNETMVFHLPDGSQSMFVELPLISTEQP
ncbi:MAG TPA: hypothetical protein VHL11_17200, partial [Phototrophicaceae bacterium]|nr:hypothetical protein [Phototrophicaceae bacterium]